MVEIKWIKLDTGIFEDEKIKIILAMPEGKSLLLVWLRLLCLAGRLNNSGVLMVNKTLPYTVEMLGAVFGESQQIMSLALDTFKKIGMIEICNGAIFLPNWEKHQAEDALARIRRNNREAQARHREKQKLTAGEDDVRLLSPYDNGRIMEQREDIDKENRNKKDSIPIKEPIAEKTTQKTENKKKKIAEGFDEFWSAYPRKTAKANALKAFEKLNPDGDLIKIMLGALSHWSKSEQWTKDNGQFIPHASTWLNGRRWEDELPAPQEPEPRERTYEMLN